MTNVNTKANELTYNQRLEQVVRLHKEGLAGNASAVQEANRLLERLRIDFPSAPLADAYHGSTMILVARDKTKPLEKLRWSKNGLKLLDKAVAAAPQDGMVRLLRGKAAFKLPEKYFHRTQTAIEDYTFLLDQQMRNEGKLGANDYSQIAYELGEAYHRIGRNHDAATVWQKLQEQTQDPELQQLLAEKLKSLEGKPPVEHISFDTPTTIVVGAAARRVGNALIDWAEKERAKDLKKGKKKKKRK